MISSIVTTVTATVTAGILGASLLPSNATTPTTSVTAFRSAFSPMPSFHNTSMSIATTASQPAFPQQSSASNVSLINSTANRYSDISRICKQVVCAEMGEKYKVDCQNLCLFGHNAQNAVENLCNQLCQHHDSVDTCSDKCRRFKQMYLLDTQTPSAVDRDITLPTKLPDSAMPPSDGTGQDLSPISTTRTSLKISIESLISTTKASINSASMAMTQSARSGKPGKGFGAGPKPIGSTSTYPGSVNMEPWFLDNKQTSSTSRTETSLALMVACIGATLVTWTLLGA